MTFPKVTAVVVTYNAWEMLKKCLPTIVDQDWPEYEVCVVDNASKDDTVVNLKKEFPTVRVLALDENRHYAGACDAGVEATQSDYVALLNNDIFLPRDFVSRSVKALQAAPKAAVVGPAVDNMNMDMTQYPYNGTMSVVGGVIHNVVRDASRNFGIPGCSFVYQRGALGLPFDRDYRFTHEEVYLSWRAHFLGYDVLRLPDLLVKHIGGASVSHLSDENRYLLERNRMLNFLTFFSTGTILRLWPLMKLTHMWERLGDLRAGRPWAPIRRARTWLRENQTVILEKRRALQAQRRVPDCEIVALMSCKLTNHANVPARIVNAVSWLWCLVVGLRTWEFQKK